MADVKTALCVAPANPLPWHVSSPNVCDTDAVDGIADADGWVVADTWGTCTPGVEFETNAARQNSRYIVHACNLYPELLTTLKSLRAYIDTMPFTPVGKDAHEIFDGVRAAADVAIAKAEATHG